MFTYGEKSVSSQIDPTGITPYVETARLDGGLLEVNLALRIHAIHLPRIHVNAAHASSSQGLAHIFRVQCGGTFFW